MTEDAAGLDALALQVRCELALFAYPDHEWAMPRCTDDGRPVHNVLIVGGGQNGLAAALALKRERIGGVTVLDENSAGEEGPWTTYARMVTLRTLKFLTGPDVGTPSLTFRAWHQARFGPGAWDDLVRIPRAMWMRYLVWLKQTLELPVRNDVRLTGVESCGALVAVHLQTPQGPETALTRKLVLATGIQGAGAPRVPDCVRDNLPGAAWAHSTERIDFTALAGRRVAVVGAGASAFDNAATALEADAAAVDLFFRRPELPTVNAYRVLESHGFFRNFGDLPDADRWRFMRRLLVMPMPPPDDTVARASRHPQFALHGGSAILDAACASGEIRLRTAAGWHATDFLILGTGVGVNLADVPALSGIAPHVAQWGDRYQPPASEAGSSAAGYPYLGPHFELLEKRPGTMPALRNIHLFNTGALISHGIVAGGLNGMPWGVQRLLAGLSRDFYRDEVNTVFAAFARYSEPDAWERVTAQAR